MPYFCNLQHSRFHTLVQITFYPGYVVLRADIRSLWSGSRVLPFAATPHHCPSSFRQPEASSLWILSSQNNICPLEARPGWSFCKLLSFAEKYSPSLLPFPGRRAAAHRTREQEKGETEVKQRLKERGKKNRWPPRVWGKRQKQWEPWKLAHPSALPLLPSSSQEGA